MKKLIATIAVAVTFVGCGASQPLPTPEIIVKTVEIPGPQPTPQVITNTVPVTPRSCLNALDINGQIWEYQTQFLGWLADEPGYKWNEGMSDRESELIDEYVIARDSCFASADIGS